MRLDALARALIYSAASAVAIAVAAASFKDLPAQADDRVGVIDRELSLISGQLRPGVRVAFLVAPGSQQQEAASGQLAQYALAPAVVHAVNLRECFAGAACPLEREELVVVSRPDPALLTWLADRYSLVPAARGGCGVILQRRPR
jgi:hypothetical protein